MASNFKIDKNKQKCIVQYYGSEKQNVVHMEECAELIQAISKKMRYPADKDVHANLVEEIADVIICISQLQEIYEINDEMIADIIERKQIRQINRIRGMKDGKNK